ncbi:MAG: redoxin family protein [Chitinophagales bacterium]
MKKTFCFYLFLCLLSLQIVHAQNSAVLSGKINNAQSKAVGMNLTPIFLKGQQPDYVVELGGNGEFNIHLNPMDAPRVVSLLHGKRKIEVYIEPGDSIFVETDMNKFSKKTIFHGGDINNFFFTEIKNSYSKKDKIEVEKKGTPAEFRQFMDSASLLQHQLLEEYAKTHKITEGAMNVAKLLIDYRHANSLLKYVFDLNRRRGKKPTVDKSYYSFIDNLVIENPALANSDTYFKFLHNYMTYQLLLKMKKTPRYDNSQYYVDLCNIDKANIKNDFLLSMMLSQHLVEGLQRARVEDLKTHYNFLMDNCKTEKYRIAAKYVYDQVKHLEAGSTAPDFKVMSIDGEEVALSDFKGKVVYLDFWASWCGPCKQQIPHAKKLKEKFKGKDVVFLYLSTDKDEKRWRDLVEAKQLTGVHLIAGKEKNKISHRADAFTKLIAGCFD